VKERPGVPGFSCTSMNSSAWMRRSSSALISSMRLAEGTLQGIAKDGALLNDRFAFQVPVS
jgi:hypothetical protein